jgi:threonyl-tRNA synthetase
MLGVGFTVDLRLNLLRDYGLNDFYLELSTRSPAKSVGSEEDWAEIAEHCARRRKKQNLSWCSIQKEQRSMVPKFLCKPKDAIGPDLADVDDSSRFSSCPAI